MEGMRMADCMDFPKDWVKFLEDYSFCDHKEYYTNGARLIPTFRVEQMMHHYLRKATEDAVPVVRCKDCKHCLRHTVPLGTYGYCNHFGYYDYAPEVHPDDFCSYGERREVE
jgi:hypothetical protein